MKWTNFDESSKEYPEKVVEKAIEGFSKATKGLAEIAVAPLDDYYARVGAKISGDFAFNVVLYSPYLKDYKFQILTFGYNIELAPIYFIIENGIYNELFNKTLDEGYQSVAKDSALFAETLEKIFTSKRFVEIVTGLMKIARKNSQSK